MRLADAVQQHDLGAEHVAVDLTISHQVVGEDRPELGVGAVRPVDPPTGDVACCRREQGARASVLQEGLQRGIGIRRRGRLGNGLITVGHARHGSSLAFSRLQS